MRVDRDGGQHSAEEGPETRHRCVERKATVPHLEKVHTGKERRFFIVTFIVDLTG